MRRRLSLLSRGFASRLCGVALACCLGGCEAPPARTFDLELKAVNTNDRILVVEGTTDLPGGAPLAGSLMHRDGRVFQRGRSSVQRGRFYFDFDLDPVKDLGAFKVVVTFDPSIAPLGVRRVTGLWGEAMTGGAVQHSGGRKLLSKEAVVLLGGQAEVTEWQGRDFEALDVTERMRLTAALERHLESQTEDREAQLALARAYLAADPKEKAVGSRAHGLLQRAVEGPERERAVEQARALLEEIEALSRRREESREKRRELVEGEPFRQQTDLVPGRSAGAFVLGSPYQAVSRYLQMEERPDFQTSGEVAVRPKDPTGVELVYRGSDRRLSAIRVTSPRFQIPEGLGVGSLLQEWQQEFGTAAVPTPRFGRPETAPDGKLIYVGEVIASGLRIEVRREVDPVFGLPVDLISALTIVGHEDTTAAVAGTEESAEPTEDAALPSESPE